MPILSLGNSVLLGVIGTCVLMNNVVVTQVCLEFRGEVFFSIIRTNDINGCLKIVENHLMKVSENFGDFRFFFHQEHPTHPSMVIYESDKPASIG